MTRLHISCVLSVGHTLGDLYELRYIIDVMHVHEKHHHFHCTTVIQRIESIQADLYTRVGSHTPIIYTTAELQAHFHPPSLFTTIHTSLHFFPPSHSPSATRLQHPHTQEVRAYHGSHHRVGPQHDAFPRDGAKGGGCGAVWVERGEEEGWVVSVAPAEGGHCHLPRAPLVQMVTIAVGVGGKHNPAHVERHSFSSQSGLNYLCLERGA